MMFMGSVLPRQIFLFHLLLGAKFMSFFWTLVLLNVFFLGFGRKELKDDAG